jgi:glycosyltransferase involved in cell wall biosynthesis
LINKKKLLIVSDTPFYKEGNKVFVFEPTLREIEEVSTLFTDINWISYLRLRMEKNLQPPKVTNIYFSPLQDLRGGKSLLKKLKVFLTLPKQCVFIYSAIPHAEIVHTRAPSVPALLAILYSIFDSKRIYWHKYAGNWNETDSPISFRLQRWLLKKINRPNVRITVNGKWPALHSGFVPFENPCLSESYIDQLASYANSRNYRSKLKVCFVGSLDSNKGAIRLLKALTSHEICRSIEGIWIVGDGGDKMSIKALSETSPIPIYLSGFLPREEIFQKIYSQCHLMVLPSASEGFPKVVAEAAAHKCIPVVTNVSALGQYITNGVNGFLLSDSSAEAIQECFFKHILPHNDLSAVSSSAFQLARLFTYERFKTRIANEILNIR